jgi:hypothetical protein
MCCECTWTTRAIMCIDDRISMSLNVFVMGRQRLHILYQFSYLVFRQNRADISMKLLNLTMYDLVPFYNYSESGE